MPEILSASPPARAVCFDLVGTLLVPDPPVAEVYHRAGVCAGSGLSLEEVRRRFRAAFRRQEEQDAGGGYRVDEDRERRRWRRVVADVFCDRNDTDGVFETLWEHFAQPASWSLYPDVADCWRRLTDAGLPIAIATNFDARFWRIAGRLPAPLDPRRVVLSSQVGYSKPSAEFYRRAARKIGVPGESILMIGDDPVNDVAAARRAGWQSVLLDRGEDEPSRDAPRISTLSETPSLLRIDSDR